MASHNEFRSCYDRMAKLGEQGAVTYFISIDANGTVEEVTLTFSSLAKTDVEECVATKPRIEPLGPAPARLIPPAPTWSQFVASMCPVRELAPGDRPRDWAKSENDSSDDTSPLEPELVCAEAQSEDKPAPARLTPQRFKVQFTASEEHVKLVEGAGAPDASLPPSGATSTLATRRAAPTDDSGRRCQQYDPPRHLRPTTVRRARPTALSSHITPQVVRRIKLTTLWVEARRRGPRCDRDLVRRK
jgi:hypothetical protein